MVAAEERDGLQCGCGWRGEMSCSNCGFCGEESWAAVSLGAVESRDGLQ